MIQSNTASINQPILDFSFPTTKDSPKSFSECMGKNIVLYFYPKDNTPGCTQESKDFRDLYSQFLELNTEVFGISRDSLKSHEKFQCKYDLPFELISDHNEQLCKYFKVIKPKNMFGIKSLGIERSTFLIDSKNILRKEWRKVKVLGHAQEVLEAVKKLAEVT
jgi:thioredoxin-dependent peroxiredoxin